MEWVVETALPREVQKLASAIEEKGNQIQTLENTMKPINRKFCGLMKRLMTS